MPYTEHPQNIDKFIIKNSKANLIKWEQKLLKSEPYTIFF